MSKRTEKKRKGKKKHVQTICVIVRVSLVNQNENKTKFDLLDDVEKSLWILKKNIREKKWSEKSWERRRGIFDRPIENQIDLTFTVKVTAQGQIVLFLCLKLSETDFNKQKREKEKEWLIWDIERFSFGQAELIAQVTIWFSFLCLKSQRQKNKKEKKEKR